MPGNLQMSDEHRKTMAISRIAESLERIASTLTYEFGPMKPQKIENPSEEMEKQHKENQEAKNREEEIAELKRSNKIATLTTLIAVVGLLLTAVIGALQLKLDYQRSLGEKTSLTTNKQSLEAVNQASSSGLKE